MTYHNPLSDLAQESCKLGERTGNKAFQHGALIFLGVSAIATTAHVLMEVLREINRHHDRKTRDR